MLRLLLNRRRGLLTAAVLILTLLSSSSYPHSDEPTKTPVDSQLLEIGPAPNPEALPKPSAELKIISYNIRWRSGEELLEIARLLRESGTIGGATILGLQEVDRNKKRSGNKNSAAILAAQLGMHYAWAAPPVTKREKEEETGVAILSAYPLSHVKRIVLPHKGPGGRRRVAIGATVKLGKKELRIYSVHSETRISVDRKLEQMKAVIHDLSHYPKSLPAIVLGDLNTWEPAAVTRTFKLFAAEDFQTPFDKSDTFYRKILFVPIELKLDWIWLRHLESTKNGIDRTVKLSDHWPLWIVIKDPRTSQ